MNIRRKGNSRNLVVANYSTANVVPAKYSPYLFDLNHLYSQLVDPNMVQGRDKEINRIFNCFLREKKKNVVLLGDHGVGKTAIMQQAVVRVTQGKCPKELRYHHFVYLDVQSIIVDLERMGMRKKLDSIMSFLIRSAGNLIVIIDQIHLTQASAELMYYLALLVRQGNVGVLGVTTVEEYYDYFCIDEKTRSRLEVILIEEPKPEKIYPMIKNVVKALEKYHKVTISKDLIEYIICVSGAFPTELSDPELTLDIIEKSMIYAKRKNQTKVDKAVINQNFNFDYELYNQMNEEDKKATSYHEAGHFILNELSNNIRNLKTTAITIVPAENFLGITLFKFEHEKQVSFDINYYIDNIAVDLAGRVAETIFYGNSDSKIYTSGARSDLCNATNTARAIVAEYGMIEDCGENMAYFGSGSYWDLSLISDNEKEQINEEAKKLIKKAYDRAEQVLRDNLPLLHSVAEALLNNEILDQKDLDRICKEYKEGKEKTNN